MAVSEQLRALLEAGVHFGHQTRRWNPKMRRFIFAERNGIYLIDLNKTLRQLERAREVVSDIVGQGKRVLFVCTKRHLTHIVREEAERCGQFYVTNRWLGGTRASQQAFDRYLATHPDGAYTELARQTLGALAASESRHARDRLARALEPAPEVASGFSAPGALAPEPGPLALELGESATPAPPSASGPEPAQEERLRDDADWLKAERRHSRAGYAGYLLAHPNGRHAKEARASLA